MENQNLSSVNLAALASCLGTKETKEAKQGVAAGSHPVNFLVRVVGVVKKGADEEKNVTGSLPQKMMVLALLSNMGAAQRQKFLRNAVDGTFELHGYTAKNLEEEWKEIADSTKKTISGKTSFAGSVEPVSEAMMQQ